MKPESDSLSGYLSQPDVSVAAEALILDATELLLELMRQQNVSRTELARAIRKSKGHVSQLLNGERNMTLRTLAEVAFALKAQVRVVSIPLSASGAEAYSARRSARPVRARSAGEARTQATVSCQRVESRNDRSWDFPRREEREPEEVGVVA